MARYNLIMKDQTFVKALEIAGKEGKSLGRWLNDVIDARVLEGNPTIFKKCFACKNDAAFIIIGYNNQTVNVCSFHKNDFVKRGKGWKQIEVQ